MKWMHRMWAVVAALALAAMPVLLRAESPATAPAQGAAGRRATTQPVAISLPAQLAPASNAPHTVTELRAVEARVEEVSKAVTPATVAVMMTGGMGSGVIVSHDGLVLTAAHVPGRPGLDCTVILADGRRVQARSLGTAHEADAGMVQITTPGEYPFVSLGKSGDLLRGQWVVALGHPGGWKRDRPAVVRLGRVIRTGSTAITTDCTLVGGDSGGPLFNLDGQLVGIHSRIGESTTANVHVPVDAFTAGWDRLVKGEDWGVAPNAPILGIVGVDDDKGCKIESVVEGGAADKAGIQAGDIVTKFDNRTIDSLATLVTQIRRHSIGDDVSIDVLRGDQKVTLKATLTRRPPGM